MSDWQYLNLEREGRVLQVAFDSGRQMNGLSFAVMRELTQLAQQLQDDSELSAIVLTGQQGMFTCGLDLSDPELLAARDASTAEKRNLLQLGPRMCAAWEALDPITIVALEGCCIGGGVALSVACDWRVAARDVRLSVPELKLGMNMSWQSIPRLANLIGPARTKRLLILAETQSAESMLDWGLLDYLAESGESLSLAKALAQQVAAMPPIPVRMTKRATVEAATALNRASSYMDADQFLCTQSTEDAEEGVRAFLEKRKPQFTGN